MNKNLIPIYDNEENATEEYIKRSTRATGSKEVRKYLKNYIIKNNCKEETKNFIRMYLENIALLNKTDLVSDGSYRSCVIFIRPDGVCVTGSGNLYKINPQYNMIDLLQHFIDNVEKVFLNVTSQTWKETNEYWSDYYIDDYEY